MGYVLFLRARTAEAPLDSSRLQVAVAEAGTNAETGTLELAASGGKIRCTVAERGIDLEVPFGAGEADFRETLLKGAELGSRLDLVFLDAQTSLEITPVSAEEVVRSWTQANKYAVDMAGRVEDRRSALPAEPPKPAWNTRSKVFLGLLVAVIVFYQLLMFSLESFKPPLRPID